MNRKTVKRDEEFTTRSKKGGKYRQSLKKTDVCISLDMRYLSQWPLPLCVFAHLRNPGDTGFKT